MGAAAGRRAGNTNSERVADDRMRSSESDFVKAAPALLALLLVATQSHARARDIGIPFEGSPGSLNAITDIPGVEVGQKTLISGDGPLNVGVGPVRTGVTVI